MFYNTVNDKVNFHVNLLGKVQGNPERIKSHICTQADVWMDSPAVPFYWISKHDDDLGSRLDCVDEVLGQERGLWLLLVSVYVAPSLVVPHSGCTGFTCQDIDSFSINPSENSSVKMQRVVPKLKT